MARLLAGKGNRSNGLKWRQFSHLGALFFHSDSPHRKQVLGMHGQKLLLAAPLSIGGNELLPVAPVYSSLQQCQCVHALPALWLLWRTPFLLKPLRGHHRTTRSEARICSGCARGLDSDQVCHPFAALMPSCISSMPQIWENVAINRPQHGTNEISRIIKATWPALLVSVSFSKD